MRAEQVVLPQERSEGLPLTFLTAVQPGELEIKDAPPQKVGIEIDTWIPWPGGGIPDTI